MAYIGTQPKDIRSFGKAKFDFTATQGQTVFTGSDDDGKTLGYTTGQITVYLNGILLDESDYTASGSNTVTLASAANAGDILSVVALQTDIPNSDYVPATGGTFSGAVALDGGITGDLDVTGTVTTDGLTVNSGATSTSVNFKNSGTPYAVLYNDTNGVAILGADDGNTGSSSSLRFHVKGGEAARINASRDVSIGTTSGIGVGAKVNVLSSGNALHVQSSNSNANNIVSHNSSGTQTFAVSNSGRMAAADNVSGPIFLITRASYSGTNGGGGYSDLNTGNYLDLNDYAAGGYNAYWHFGTAQWVNGSTDGFAWNKFRLIFRAYTPGGGGAYFRVGSYFYVSGWNTKGASFGAAMDTGRGYLMCTSPWVNLYDMDGWGDVCGLGLYCETGQARVGAVYIQYSV